MKFKRVMLKVSGEVLGGANRWGVDFEVLKGLALEIEEVYKLGAEIAVVIGGGNFWRYRDFAHTHIDRTSSDYLGMLATVMNSIALKSTLEGMHLPVQVMSSLNLPQLADEYLVRNARRALTDKKILICAGGTGNPYFTTDSAAALRAVELSCDVMLKASNVDYLYDQDPKDNPNAKPYLVVSYNEVLEKQLKLMDLTAISLCMVNKIPINVFNLKKPGNIAKVISGEEVGTLVQ